MRVLVHEPDPVLRRLLVRQLGRLGHAALHDSGGGVEAAVIETSGIEGLALARAVRLLRPDIRLVIASTLAASPATAQLRPWAHLRKPVRLACLAAALRTA